MAKAQGYTCDGCGKFEVSSENNMAPSGWMRLTLPRGEGDPDIGTRDLCSGRCVEKFGKERRQAEGGGPRSSGNGSSKMDPALLAWLDASGVEPRLRGGVMGRHVYRHKTQDSAGCPVCEFEAEHATTVAA